MANYFAKPGVVERAVYVDNLDRSIEALWMRRDEHAGVLGQFFDAKDTESISFKVSSVGTALTLPKKSEDTDQLPQAQPATGYDKTITQAVYRLGIRVTDTFIRADRFNRAVEMSGGLIKSAMRKMEYLRADIFNNAFTGTSGADSLSLCNDSHPHENPEAGTWDNNGTAAALSGTSLQALRLLGDKMTNEQGDPDPVMAEKLLVPPDLRQKALELVGSPKRAEDALNGVTVIIGDFEVVVSPFLSSTTAFFLIGDRSGWDKGLHELYLLRPSLDDVGDATADIPISKRVKMITAVDYTISKNVFGNAGA